MPVCKRKYQPHRRRRKIPCISQSEQGTPRATQEEEEEEEEDQEEMYACHLHHAKRKALIERHGPRNGWENFSQWHRHHGRVITPAAAESCTSGGGSGRRIMQGSDEVIGDVGRTPRTSVVPASADTGTSVATGAGTAGDGIAAGHSGPGRKRPRGER